MKKIILCMLVICLAVFSGCHGGTQEDTVVPSFDSTAPTVPSVPETTAPEETVPTETTVPVTDPPETTEPPREYVAQDPDTNEYPEDYIQATLSFYSGMLYVNDNRADALVEKLPEGYIYIGVTGYPSPSTSIPKMPLVTCNVPAHTEFYGSLENPDYIYYELDGKYRRMIRAGLVENYWDDQQIDPNVPDNYTELFFQSLLQASTGRNRYHCATCSDFDRPEDVNIAYLFYGGFYEEKAKKLTEEEEKFLLSDGWGNAPIGPVSNAKRLPVWRMDADLRRFFGIGFDEISGIGFSRWQSYWSETGCYYMWVSDTISRKIVVDKVEYDESSRIYTVSYTPEYGYENGHEHSVMRLRLVGDTFQVLSNKITPVQ